jgi:hypothetical protein
MRKALLLGMMLWGVAGCQVEVDADPVNLAAEAVISASSTFCGGSAWDCYAASRINDGDADTSLGGEYSWANDAGAALPQWVELDFVVARTFGRVELYTTQAYPIQDYSLETWDGTTWNAVVTITGNTEAHRTHTFTPVTASKLRILGRKGPSRQAQYVRVNEVEIYQD